MTRPRAAVYIGLDLGTSGLKGVALTTSGEVIGRGSAAYPTARPSAGAAEQAPQDWIAAVESVAGEIRDTVPARYWRGIGLSAMIPTLVTVGADGEPVGPAITWQDGRADGWGDELREMCGAQALYKVTGQWVDGRYLLPMYLRVAAEEPARAAATTMVLSAKDYLFGWLVGEVATDPSTASGFGCYELDSGRWNSGALAAARQLAGRAAGMSPRARGSTAIAQPDLPALPPVRASMTCLPLRAEAAARLGCGPVPVCMGAADSVLGALGLGIREPGQIAYIAGTSTVILGICAERRLDPHHRFLVTPLSEPGHWGLEMDQLATGSAISWLAGLLFGRPDAAAVSALATQAQPAEAPVVLPYLSPGEQGALWDPLVMGTFAGLMLSHGRRHLARGLVNGIVLESRRCLAVLDETAPFTHDLAVAGSSASDPAFRAELADATRRAVAMPSGNDTDFSARGAAMLAARSIGGQWLPSSPDGKAQPVAKPDAARAAAWDKLWAQHEQARQAIALHYHAGHPLGSSGSAG